MNKGAKLTRRELLAAATGSSLVALGRAAKGAASDAAAAPEEIVRYFPIRHGGIHPVRHARLGVDVSGQSAVSTLRFIRPVRLNRIEIPAVLYARDQPPVPCHPAHVTVSVFRRDRQLWETVRDLTLPPFAKFSGEGLSPKASTAEMQAFFEKAYAEERRSMSSLGRRECFSACPSPFGTRGGPNTSEGNYSTPSAWPTR